MICQDYTKNNFTYQQRPFDGLENTMIFIILVLTIFLLDEKIKQYIEKNKEFNQEDFILGGTIRIEKHHNKGAMLNFLEKRSYIVKYTSALLLGVLCVTFFHFLPKKREKLLTLSLALILGGACSNVYDRLKRGYVVDYFSFHYKKLKTIIFNISDLFIMIGAFLMMIHSFLRKR